MTKNVCVFAMSIASLAFSNPCLALSCDAQTHAKESTAAVAAAPAPAKADEGISINGVVFAIPAPDDTYFAMPEAMKNSFESSQPPTNRILCAYISKNDPSGMTTASAISIRPLEAAMLDEATFGQIVGQTKAMMNGASLEQAMKSVDKNNLVAGQPKLLGTMFERADVYASATLVALNLPTGQVQMISGTAMLRVKQKLLLVCMTAKYDDEKSAENMKVLLDAWINTLMSLNK
jgi:hypothetical protein